MTALPAVVDGEPTNVHMVVLVIECGFRELFRHRDSHKSKFL